MEITYQVKNWDMLMLLFGGAGGGVLAQVGSYWIKKRRENRSDIELLLDTLKEDNLRLRKEISMAKETIVRLERRIDRQRVHLTSLQAGHYNHPWPAWIKGTDGEMIMINPAYEKVFLEPRGYKADDYINNKDEAVWSEATVMEYQKNDSWVVRHKKAWQGLETIDDYEEKWFITKYPLMHDNEVIGIAGMAVPAMKIVDLYEGEVEPDKK